MTALMIGSMSFCSTTQAAEVEVEPSLSEVAAGESNEDFLNYLELTDYFVMSAERIPTSKWDTPANVSIITADEIEKNHYQTVAEALSHVNGVVVTQYGRADTQGFVNINGSGRVLLLIDGHRANPSQDAYVSLAPYAYQTAGLCDLSLIPSIKVIDRIEIVKGGASALYGSDAVGGVVNVITKKGERDETTVDVNYGSWHRYNLEATNQGVKGKLSWFVTAGLGGSDEAKHPGTAHKLFNNTDYKDRDFSIRLDDQFNDRDSLTIDYMHRSHDFADELSRTTRYEKYYNTQYDFYNMYNSASIEYKFKGDTSTPGWLRYFNNYQKGYSVGTDLLYGESRIQGAEYQNGWEFGSRHKFIAGVEWHRVEASSPGNGYDENVDTIASYVQDTISLGNKWTLVPGLRYDHDKDFGGNWSPKIAANYRADDKTKIYASWGKTYSIPTIGELYMYYDGWSTNGAYSTYWSLWQIGGANSDYVNRIAGLYTGLESMPRNIMSLEPETGYSATIGMEHDFDDRTNASLSFFQNKLKNAIIWNQDEATNLKQYVQWSSNDLIQKNRGLELTFKQNLTDRWSYDLGYSHTSVDNTSSRGGTTYNMRYAQPNGYRVGVHYNIGKWRANLLGVMASGLDTTRFVSKSYAVLDFNTSYDFTDRASVYFRTLNFTDERYSTYSRTTIAPGRFLQIGATYKF